MRTGQTLELWAIASQNDGRHVVMVLHICFLVNAHREHGPKEDKTRRYLVYWFCRKRGARTSKQSLQLAGPRDKHHSHLADASSSSSHQPLILASSLAHLHIFTLRVAQDGQPCGEHAANEPGPTPGALGRRAVHNGFVLHDAWSISHHLRNPRTHDHHSCWICRIDFDC